MSLSEEQIYNSFSQSYMDNVDQLKEITAEVEELLSKGIAVPKLLANELHRLQFVVSILTQMSNEKYSKSPEQLYQDGWNCWYKENVELREKRYGGKNNG
jgi:hypothetical protein